MHLNPKQEQFVDVVRKTLLEEHIDLAKLRREQLDKKIKELEKELEKLIKKNKKKEKKIKKLKKQLAKFDLL